MMSFTIAASFGSSEARDVYARSIFKMSTGSRRSCVIDVNPVPKSSMATAMSPAGSIGSPRSRRATIGRSASTSRCRWIASRWCSCW